MKLLVIDDEIRLAEYLRKGLSEEGYVVGLARIGIDGLHLASKARLFDRLHRADPARARGDMKRHGRAYPSWPR